MSSACTCHVNPEECAYCRWEGMKVGTFGCGAAIMFPDGRMMKFNTLNMDDSHELANALSDLVFGFEIEETLNKMLKHENLRIIKENEELMKQSYISNVEDDVKYAEEFAGVSAEADKIQENSTK